MATGAPDGVVTMSISVCTRESARSSTIIAKIEVPAETLPVRTPTLLVAAMPVPASPSGGQSGMPASSSPETSSRRAPASVRTPASSPAQSTWGRMSPSFQVKPRGINLSSSSSTMRASKSSASLSIGNIPEASPMPSTRLPVSIQCT